MLDILVALEPCPEALRKVMRDGICGRALLRVIDANHDRARELLQRLSHHENGAWRLVDELGGSRADQDSLGAARAVRADGDKRVIPAGDLVEQLLPGAALGDLPERIDRRQLVRSALERFCSVLPTLPDVQVHGRPNSAAHHRIAQIVHGEQREWERGGEGGSLPRGLERLRRVVNADEDAAENRASRRAYTGGLVCGRGHDSSYALRTTRTEQAARWATRSLTLPSARSPWRPRLPTTSRSASCDNSASASTGWPGSLMK